MIDITRSCRTRMREDIYACHRVALALKNNTSEDDFSQELAHDLLTVLKHWTDQALAELNLLRAFSDDHTKERTGESHRS